MSTITAKDLIGTAAKFEADAQKLREAAAILDYSNGTGHGPGKQQTPQAKPFDGTRAEQLKDYLKRRGGAATRQEILGESGIPAGTVASLLGFSKKFIKDRHERWHVRGTAYLKQQADAVKEQKTMKTESPVEHANIAHHAAQPLAAQA